MLELESINVLKDAIIHHNCQIRRLKEENRDNEGTIEINKKYIKVRERKLIELNQALNKLKKEK